MLRVLVSRLRVPLIALALALLGSALLAGTSNANTPLVSHPLTAAQVKPDLIITGLSLRSYVGCAPGTPVYIFDVTVTNVAPAGSATTWEAVVRVRNTPTWAGEAYVPKLGAGQSETVRVAIPYLPHPLIYGLPHPLMIDSPTHTFTAQVDVTNLIDERIESNNTSFPLTVNRPTGCERLPVRSIG
jgi:hypothetical protein